MTRTPAPAFYDDLDLSLAEAWRMVTDGVTNRRSPCHTPTVATIGLDGAPRLRTVVLRAAEVDARTLRFHTDLRGAKVAEIGRDPRIGVHFYNPEAKIQLRLSGRATIHPVDDGGAEAWAGSRSASRICYSILPGPGTPIGQGAGFTLASSAEAIEAGVAHFAAVCVHVGELEWLYLHGDGHRRARFSWGNDQIVASWLAP